MHNKILLNIYHFIDNLNIKNILYLHKMFALFIEIIILKLI